MNNLLNRKININIVKIIGSYLLPKYKKLNMYSLKSITNPINLLLDLHYVFSNNTGPEIIGCENFDKCKITYLKHCNQWTIKLKNYKSNFSIFSIGIKNDIAKQYP